MVLAVSYWLLSSPRALEFIPQVDATNQLAAERCQINGHDCEALLADPPTGIPD